jgi:hypothetical protein
MFKTISAALLAASMLAAPAFAATGKITQAPAAKAQLKADHVKPSALNANAAMEKHQLRHHRHHRHHVAAIRTHRHAKVSFRHVAPTKTKRG